MSQRIFGLHAARAVLEHAPERVRCAWLDRQRHDHKLEDLRTLLRSTGIAFEASERKRLDRLSGSRHHQGVVLDVALPPERDEAALEGWFAKGEGPLFLVLDRVQDPHNLGACLRTCDAVGATGVIVPRDNSVGLTPTVCKVASGAAETVPLFRVTNLARTLERLKQAGVWIAGAAAEAEQIAFEADLSGPLALVIGAEGQGLRRLTRKKCDFFIRLPMRGTVESLNLSVVAGVLLYETVRQRDMGRSTSVQSTNSSE